MKINDLSYRGKIRTILYIFFVVLVLGIFSIITTNEAIRYRQEVILTRQMALINLDECLSNISTNLEKIMYATSPSMISTLSSELYRETSIAKNALSFLPTSGSTLSNTYKMLSQTGEFVMSLERKASKGETISSEERSQIKSLYEYCLLLSESVTEMCHQIHNGNFTFEDRDSTLLGNNKTPASINSSFEDAEQSFSDFPTLIYDGPFSSHLESSSPKALENKETISKEKALEIAKNISGINNLELKFEETGNIPCYVFQKDYYFLAITKSGGIPIYMLNNENAGEIKIKYSVAIENAKKFLAKLGYKDLKESYYFTENGICTINFAAYENDVIYYPDLVKVSINLENGEIVGFDATGYITNHYSRSLPTEIMTENEVISLVSKQLEIISIQKCVIPTKWKTENFCYEIHCKSEDGTECLIYVNCVTGDENEILILLYSDGGVLTK